MEYEFKTEIPDRAMANQTAYTAFVVPDTVKRIGKEAFIGSRQLKKIYIPKSVTVIERDAFAGCTDLEIYCEDEPREGWVCGMRKETVFYEITTPEDDAFNFHRSGGSFTSTKVEREVEKFHNWNPSGCPVHTHVPRSVTESWEKPAEKVRIFYLSDCPYCHMARRAMKELMAEHREFSKLNVVWVEEDEQPKLAEQYDYYYVPSVFFGKIKLYEARPGEQFNEIKRAIERAFLTALAEK